MNNGVEFVSDAFPSYPGEDESINPGIWGKRLAEFLVSGFLEQGIRTKEFYAEDWGWEIPVENEAFPIHIGCSNQLEPGGNHFLVIVSPSKPRIRKGLFKKVDTTADVGRVVAALEKILAGKPEIREIRWSDEYGT